MIDDLDRNLADINDATYELDKVEMAISLFQRKSGEWDKFLESAEVTLGVAISNIREALDRIDRDRRADKPE